MRYSLLILLSLISLSLRAEEPTEEARDRIRQQALETEAKALLREAEAAAASGDFKGALEFLRPVSFAVLRLPEGGPVRVSIEQRVLALRPGWEGSAREQAVAEERARAALAESDLMRELRKERERLESSRDRLLSRFEDAVAHSAYAEAEKALRDLRALDPSDAGLNVLRDRLAEIRHLRVRAGTQTSLDEEWRNLREFAVEQAVPYSAGILRYPDHWSRMTQSRQEALRESLEHEEAWRIALRRRLAKNLHCRFSETPFPEAVVTLEALGGASINVDASAREKVADLDALKITFRSPEEGMSFEHALTWLLKGTGLAWSLGDEAIRIASPEKAQDPPVLQRHDVRDILAMPVDMAGPSMGLSAAGKGMELKETANEEAAFKGEDLVAFLKEHVQPAVWNEPQNSLSYRNGTLFVNAPPEVQQKVRGVLGGFRSQQTLQVMIQTRFITATELTFERIGVDWKGLNATGSLASVSTLAPPVAGGATPLPGFSNPRGLRTDIRAAVSNEGQFLGSVFPRAFGGGTIPSTNGGLGMQVAFLDNFQAQALIEAAEKSGKANLLTAPTLLCFNTQRANLLSVTQQAYIQDITAVVQVQAVGYDPEIGYVQTGIVFDVRPIVSADRKYVTLELRPTISQLQTIRTVFTSGSATRPDGTPITNIFIEAPVLNLTSVRGTVSVPDGGTLLIGGLTQFDETHNHVSVPFLSKIPFLHALFSTRADAGNRQNLVILAKVQVIDQREIEEDRFGKE